MCNGYTIKVNGQVYVSVEFYMTKCLLSLNMIIKEIQRIRHHTVPNRVYKTF